MKKYDVHMLELVEKSEIAKNIFDFKLKNAQIAKITEPGQFLHIAVPGMVLRRPISVCDVTDDCIRIVFRIKGDGTRRLSEAKKGDMLDVLGPLGNGFDIEKGKTYAFVGGGIGVPPMLYSAKRAQKAYAVLGFANKDAAILCGDFKAAGCELFIATEDGSLGVRGFVTEPLENIIDRVDGVCACGPIPMLKAVAELCRKNGKPCQVSLEERMGCGIGACLVCACKTHGENGDEYKHVCKNGPVFDAEEVAWNG